jgi:hypothetical protein
MGDCSQEDEVWEHGENIYREFVCKYCKCSKKGGGATHFKQHLVGRGNNVKHCSCVPPDVHDYFQHQFDQTTDRKKSKQKKRVLREEVAAEGNVIHDIDSDDEELQRALHASRKEEQFARATRELGGGGGGGTIWARWWFISTTRWLAWKVEDVKLAEGEKHSRANKDRHKPMVNEEQTCKNSY